MLSFGLPQRWGVAVGHIASGLLLRGMEPLGEITAGLLPRGMDPAGSTGRNGDGVGTEQGRETEADGGRGGGTGAVGCSAERLECREGAVVVGTGRRGGGTGLSLGTPETRCPRAGEAAGPSCHPTAHPRGRPPGWRDSIYKGQALEKTRGRVWGPF